VVALAALGALLGLAFAGSPARLAEGVRIDGVDVGGMEPAAARRLLERKAESVEHVPVAFTASGRAFRVTADELGVAVDWAAAVEDARRQGEGFGPLRGFRRLDVRFFGADVVPPVRAYQGALTYELSRIARAVDRPHRQASIRLRGLRPVVVGARSGLVLDRRAAAGTIVRALARLSRRSSVALPVRLDAATVTAPQLASALVQTRRAVSAPVRLALSDRRFLIPRWRIAQLLQLPADGRTTLAIGGREADRWLGALGRTVEHPPQDADFIPVADGAKIVPDKPGVTLDANRTASALLRAAIRPAGPRIAVAVVRTARAKLTVARAKAMGLVGLVSTYTTVYGGVANRIHNVQLVANLIDRKLIAPGATFSFNQATGERSAAKGFLEAPVIINGELKTGLGGGVCQVSTTVFNAAYEAGLRITERTNHALYISHYPQGRDATVNYPNVDLKFVNDTGHWLLLRTFVGSSELTVALFGTPTHRKVETTTAPLVTVAPPPVKRTVDPSLAPGEIVVADPGESAFSTSVERKVYDANGKLLYDDTWSSHYVASPKLVSVGPVKPKAKQKPQPGETTTESTTTTTATTTETTPTQP
jgi:vancomycin resistance protein YoaR